ncbi:MAG: hypothetical protein ACON5F_15725 [Jejuia sp.]
MEQKSAFDSFELDVNQKIKGYLGETSKWSYFLSIMGFIGIGFMIVLGIFMASINAGSPLAWGDEDPAFRYGYSFGVALFYIIIALVYLFPVLYLFRFSRSMKNALKNDNNEEFVDAFKNLKSHYKFIAIFTIAIIALYLIIIFGIAIGAGSGMF